MKNYNASRVVSLRIGGGLLETVRKRAEAEGRSVSGQIVFFVRAQVEREAEASKPPQKISGWLSHRPAPPAYEEFRRARTTASKKLRAAVKRKARER
jgi:hypothetical protein